MNKGTVAIIFLMFWVNKMAFCYSHVDVKTTAFDPKDLHIEWKFETNNYNSQSKFLASLILTNKDRHPIPESSWKLYFSLRYHGILQSVTGDFTINHIKGDLFYISPSPSFNGLNSGQSIKIEYTGNGMVANYQDAPSGIFWVNNADDLPHALSLGNITYNSGSLKGADAQSIFEQNRDITDIPIDKLPLLMPAPVSFTKERGVFIWDSQVEIVPDSDFKTEACYLSSEFKFLIRNSSTASAKKKQFVLRKNTLPNEAYDLIVSPTQIVISASSGAGIFYGIQSLKNLLPASSWAAKQITLPIPCVIIHDAPRFPVRAFMLDVSRNFQSKQEILKLLDVMALYKLNTFHFHFTDDEGWRIEIPGLPELTTVGSQRGYPFDHNRGLQPSYGSGPTTADKMGSGYYARKDFIEILKYAQLRHIKIIPEIESPGHARAAVISMLARYNMYMKLDDRKQAEQYLLTDMKDSSVYTSAQSFNDNVMNPALPSTYRFIEKVIDELTLMYKEAGADLTMIHMGGDEVPNGAWEKSPAIIKMMRMDTSLHTVNDIFRAYFFKVNNLLNKRKLKLYAWEELAIGTEKMDNARKVIKIPEFVKNGVSVDAWYNVEGNEDIPYQAANVGYKTVLTNLDYYYFDLAYQSSFHEPGDEWLGFLDTKKVLSFMPYDYYSNATVDFRGKPFPAGYFDKKIRPTSVGRQNIAGVQGALWGENIRSAKQMEYMILPRLLALAETAWAKAPQWELNNDTARSTHLYNQYWNIFANQVGKKELPKLASYHGGYNFRIPVVGLKEVGGSIVANQQFPGMKIHYSTNGLEPTSKSPVYSTPLKLKGVIKMKAFDNKGRNGETTSITIN